MNEHRGFSGGGGIRGSASSSAAGVDLELEHMLKIAALTSAWLYYLSPMVDFQEVRRTKDVGERIFFPYICMWMSCSLWAEYGLFIGDMFPMFYTNLLGLLCSSYYCTMFLWAAQSQRKRVNATGMVTVAFALTGAMSAFLFSGGGDPGLNDLGDLDEQESSRRRTWGGLVASVSTVVQYASPLAGLVKVVRRRSTEGMSPHLSLLGLACGALWLGYGAAMKDPWLVIPNLLGSLLSALQCLLFLLFPRRRTMMTKEHSWHNGSPPTGRSSSHGGKNYPL